MGADLATTMHFTARLLYSEACLPPIRGCELLSLYHFRLDESSVLEELQTILGVPLGYIKISLYSLSVILLRRIIMLKGCLEIFHSGLSDSKIFLLMSQLLTMLNPILLFVYMSFEGILLLLLLIKNYS